MGVHIKNWSIADLRAKAAPVIIPASFENPAKSRDNHEIDEEEEGK